MNTGKDIKSGNLAWNCLVELNKRHKSAYWASWTSAIVFHHNNPGENRDNQYSGESVGDSLHARCFHCTTTAGDYREEEETQRWRRKRRFKGKSSKAAWVFRGVSLRLPFTGGKLLSVDILRIDFYSSHCFQCQEKEKNVVSNSRPLEQKERLLGAALKRWVQN